MYIYLCDPWKLCMTCSAREVTSQAIAPFRATWPGWRGADDGAQKKTIVHHMFVPIRWEIMGNLWLLHG